MLVVWAIFAFKALNIKNTHCGGQWCYLVVLGVTWTLYRQPLDTMLQTLGQIHGGKGSLVFFRSERICLWIAVTGIHYSQFLLELLKIRFWIRRAFLCSYNAKWYIIRFLTVPSTVCLSCLRIDLTCLLTIHHRPQNSFISGNLSISWKVWTEFVNVCLFILNFTFIELK